MRIYRITECDLRHPLGRWLVERTFPARADGTVPCSVIIGRWHKRSQAETTARLLAGHAGHVLVVPLEKRR